MTATVVVHYHTKGYTGALFETGSAALERALLAVLGGHAEGSIDRVDRYDTDEHIADDISEDFAKALARAVVSIGDPPSTQVRDFCDAHVPGALPPHSFEPARDYAA